MPNNLLLCIVLGIGSGIVLGHTFLPGIISVGIAGLIIFFFRDIRVQKNTRQLVLLVSVFLCAVMLGYIRFSFEKNQILPSLDSLAGEQVTLTGVIEDDPSGGDTKKVFLLRTQDHIGVRVTVWNEERTLLYKDKVIVTGRLRLPENFTTETGREFDYISYLAKDEVQYLLPSAKIERHTPDETFSLQRELFHVRRVVESTVFELLPTREASFVAGILLGTRTSIDDDFRLALIQTGTIHVLALSGYNVSIVAGAITKTLSYLFSQTISFILGGVGIILFIMMTGAQATALRAGGMALLGLFARATGRTTQSIRLLGIALLGLFLYDPKLLIYDMSFQLSVLATLGIIVFGSLLVAWWRTRVPFFLAEIIGTTLSAQIGVLPYLMYVTGLVSLISFPLNIIIAPFIPLAMLLGFCLVVFGILIPPLAPIVGYVTHLVVLGINESIFLGAAVPYGSVVVPEFPGIVVVLVYGAIGIIVYRKRNSIFTDSTEERISLFQ